MPGSNYLIDTNIVIEVFSGDREIADKINDLNGFSISSTILGELFVGVYRVANKTKHLKKLNAFLEICDDILTN